jgi:hypothetical protein
VPVHMIANFVSPGSPLHMIKTLILQNATTAMIAQRRKKRDSGQTITGIAQAVKLTIMALSRNVWHAYPVLFILMRKLNSLNVSLSALKDTLVLPSSVLEVKS